MKVFDFDNTLYHGESAVDFALFMLRRENKIILWLPKIFWNLLKYKLCLVRREGMEAQLDRFMQCCLPDAETVRRLVKQFWKSHSRKLNTALICRIAPDDIIITASPDFLLLPIQTLLGTSNWICSEVDLVQKSVIDLNFSERKVQRFRKRYGNAEIHAFYTDSYYDSAMIKLAKRAYLVKKGRARRIK